MKNQVTVTRKYFSIVSTLVLLGLCGVTWAEEKVGHVRVAAYNVEFGKNASPEEIGEMFKPYRLDIIGFCEAPDGDWTHRVGKQLGMEHAYVGKISSAHHEDKYKSILSRTPLERQEEYPLGGGQVWNPASAVRAVTTIRGITIAFYSLHISSSDGKTGHGPQLVTEVLPKERENRVIVLGDFNNRLGEPAMDQILDAGFRVTWKDLGINVQNIFTYNALKPEHNGGVIDHIVFNAATRGKATDGGIIELDKPLSDHKPVWAEITFPVE